MPEQQITLDLTQVALLCACATSVFFACIALVSVFLARLAGRSLMGPVLGPMVTALLSGNRADEEDLEESLKNVPHHDPKRLARFDPRNIIRDFRTRPAPDSTPYAAEVPQGWQNQAQAAPLNPDLPPQPPVPPAPAYNQFDTDAMPPVSPAQPATPAPYGQVTGDTESMAPFSPPTYGHSPDPDDQPGLGGGGQINPLQRPYAPPARLPEDDD
jgi:hypothetical protein